MEKRRVENQKQHRFAHVVVRSVERTQHVVDNARSLQTRKPNISLGRTSGQSGREHGQSGIGGQGTKSSILAAGSQSRADGLASLGFSKGHLRSLLLVSFAFDENYLQSKSAFPMQFFLFTAGNRATSTWCPST